MLITDLLDFQPPMFCTSKREKLKTNQPSSQNKLIPLQVTYCSYISRLQLERMNQRLREAAAQPAIGSRAVDVVSLKHTSAATRENKPSDRVMMLEGFKEHVGAVR